MIKTESAPRGALPIAVVAPAAASRFTAWALLVLTVAALSGCWDSNQPNALPVAVTGTSLSGTVGEAVTLDASRSYDPEGEAVSYAWTVVSRPPGSTATLSGAGTARPSLVPDAAGDYRLQLVVR